MIAVDKDGNGKDVGVTPTGYKAKKIIMNRDDVVHMKQIVMYGSREDTIKWFDQLVARFE